MDNFKCELCNKTFSRRGNLNLHLTAKHSEVKYECNICNFFTRRKYDLRRHIELKHRRSKLLNQTAVKCSLCTETRTTKDSILEHYIAHHNIVLLTETLDFKNEEQFYIWKMKIETEQQCKFCIFRSKYKHKTDGSSRLMYVCHRDGEVKSKGKNIRQLKIAGSYKINGHCPAKLEVIFLPEGHIKVNFCKTHVCHTSDLEHLRLSQTEKDGIAHRLAMNVPFDKILDQVRFGIVSKGLLYKDFLSREDLYNIKHEYNLKAEALRHKIDIINIESWVREMEDAGEIVIFYKPQGIVVETYEQACADDFILIVMNEDQKEMLKDHGSKCICFDSTYGVTSYGLGLTTLLILDDLNQAFPCAFMFSNREDLAVIELFVSSIKYAINSTIQANIFMSDIAEGYYNSWVNIMPSPKFRLFCTWHVDCAWRKNLTKIRGHEKQAEVYKLLRTVLEERDKEVFTRMLPQVIDVIKEDADTRDFALYFEKEYKESVERWAYCYHLHSGLNTNLHFERMHRIIKHIYMNGKKPKRLDVAFYALMRFIRDKLSEKLMYLNRSELCHKIVALHQQHRDSLELSTENIVYDEDTWKVQSLDKSEIYEIRQTNQLNCDCDLFCTECNICIHAYICSCPDSAIKFNMCKHIHAVRRKINIASLESSFTEQTESDLIIEEFPNNINLEEVTRGLQQTSQEEDEELEQKKAKIMYDLKNILDEVHCDDQLELINRAVGSLKPAIKACAFKQVLPSEF